MAQDSPFAKPDFAYPKQVSSTWKKELEKGLAANNDPLIIRSLLNVGLAEVSISNGNIPATLKTIKVTADRKSSTPQLRAMLLLIEADIYSSIYLNDRWKYNQRSLPLSPLPDDYNEWSGEQFRSKVISLVDSVLSYAPELAKVPLSDYNGVLTAPSHTRFYPTLLDFAVSKAQALVNEMQSWNNQLSPEGNNLITKGFNLLYKYNAPDSPAYFLAQVNELLSNGENHGDLNAELFKFYKENEQSPYSAIPLLYLERIYDKEQARELYFALESFKTRNPHSFLNKDVKKRMAELMNPSISCTYAQSASPDLPLKVKVNIENVRNVKIRLYTVKEGNRRRYNPFIIDSLVSETELTFDTVGPFSVCKTVDITLPGYGLYTVKATPADTLPNLDNNPDVCYCSNIYIMALSKMAAGAKGTIHPYVMDFVTGKPVNGAEVWADDNYLPSSSTSFSVTDSKGTATLKQANYLHAVSDDDRFSRPLSTSSRYVRTLSPRQYATVTTSLPLYRFGDTMEWGAFVYGIDSSTARAPLANQKVEVKLLNPNYIMVDSVVAVTDDWGRVKGEFTIPTTSLAGNFTIVVSQLSDGENSSDIGRGAFMVSDYKLPTFTVEVTDIRRDFPSKGDVTVNGVAKTYSGFPVSDAKVEMETYALTGRFWWDNNREHVVNLSDTTNASGAFSIIIPSDNLAAHDDAAISVAISVNSPAGETRGTSTVFTLGKHYAIRAELPANLDVEKPVNLNIQLLSPTLSSVDSPLEITIYKPKQENVKRSHYNYYAEESRYVPGDSVASFTISSGAEPIDLRDIPSGEYIIKVAPVDAALADPFLSDKLFIYRDSQSGFPLSSVFWTPVGNNSTVSLDSRKKNILVGTSCGTLNILCVISTNDSIISTKWHTIKKGMSRIPVELGSGLTHAKVDFMGINSGTTFSRNFNVTTPENAHSLKFTIESFRDKVSPLSTETWRFRTRMIDGTDTVVTPAAVILQMLSASINDLRQMPDIRFTSASRPWTIFTYFPEISRCYDNFTSRNDSYYNGLNICPPEFNLYDMSWTGERRLYFSRNGVKACLASAKYESDDASVELREYSDGMVADRAVLTEAAPEEEVADAGTGAAEENKSENYRPSEIPLALFEPMLTTSEDGSLEYSVTFPDASTTWILNATAYAKDMTSQQFTRNIVAAHPLMVQTSLPRFLRLGDNATLTATVMNNSGDTLSAIATRFEAVDPSDGSVIAFAEEQISLENGRMKVITLQLLADRLTPGLIVRAKAACGDISDGEQAMIAILQDSQPVVETTPFTLAPDQNSVSLKFDGTPDSKVTLEFCQNPTWSVVTALPSLRTEPYRTSIDAAAAICSAAVAEKLLNSNPAIGTAIRQWLASDQSDSTLVSMLERNPDLKIALLEATPWMTDAMSDTQRMQRLALLFDRKEINAVYTSAIHELAKLQRSKGWAWTAGGEEPSYWATLSVLEILGYLHTLDCLPDNKQLATMIRNAVEYIDTEAIESTKLKKGKVAPDIFYTYVRTPYTEIRQPSAARRVSEATIQDMLANWKKYSTRDKAFTAIILAQNNYHSSARAIVASISEFGIESAKGLSWKNASVGTTARILQAYALTGQPKQQIDDIRRWLILEKAANNWGNTADATCVIYNILATGSQWTKLNPGTALVTVNSTEILPDKLEKITGYLRTDISPEIKEGENSIVIARTGQTPAYGSIYAISTRPMKSVPAAGCDELTVEKRFLVKDLTGNDVTWRETTEFNVGDVVKTSLTIKVTAKMQYVAIVDNRAAAFEPVNQLPATIWSEGLLFYRQTDDSASSIFIDYLPVGTYILEQEFTVTHAGRFTSGLATIQSQYAPQYTAHSAGTIITVK